MTDERILHHAARRGARIYCLGRRSCGAALNVGGRYYVGEGPEAAAAVLWILVRRRHRNWSPRRIREFLERDLGIADD